MQQSELTESVIYAEIAKFAKGEENKQTLLRLSEEEKIHYEIWKSYTGIEMQPEKFKVFKYKLLARIFGFTFAVKLMENGEENSQDEYEKLADEMDARGGSRVVEIWSECKFRHLYDREWFGEGSMMPFEDIEIRMPDKNHEIMSLYYGDYMTLPPEEDRDIQHKMEIVQV